MKYQKCIDQQILSWHKFSIQRYQLMDHSTSFLPALVVDDHKNCNNCKNCNMGKPTIKDYSYTNTTKAHLNHPKRWDNITRVVLHATTKKLLSVYIFMHSDMVVEATLVGVDPKAAGKLELNGFREQ